MEKNLTDGQLLELALHIATEAHKGQKDKAGEDYIHHPLRVAARCGTLPQKITALLHDVIEDTAITATDLAGYGFPDYIIEAVQSVTRHDGEDYFEYIKRAAANPIGHIVKLYDLEDNMDIRRLNIITEKDMERLNRYLKAWRILKA